MHSQLRAQLSSSCSLMSSTSSSLPRLILSCALSPMLSSSSALNRSPGVETRVAFKPTMVSPAIQRKRSTTSSASFHKVRLNQVQVPRPSQARESDAHGSERLIACADSLDGTLLMHDVTDLLQCQLVCVGCPSNLLPRHCWKGPQTAPRRLGARLAK